MGWDYLSRLSRAARWYLPPAEAAEVLEDYREIVEGRSEEELRRDIGSPRDAVRCLVQPGTYRRWLTVFGALAACELVPALMAWNSIFRVPIPYFTRYLALALAMGISFSWFRREGRREKRLPKAIPFFMAAALIGMVWAWFLAWVAVLEWRAAIDFFFPPEQSEWLNLYRGQLISGSLVLYSAAMIAVSLFGLIKARLGDRRWHAVYLSALTGSLVALSVYGLLTRMSFYPGWQVTTALRIAILTAAGLIGTGVSLC